MITVMWRTPPLHRLNAARADASIDGKEPSYGCLNSRNHWLSSGDADRLTLREQIDALADPDIDEDEQVRLWRRVKALAPSMMDVGRQIFVSVATAYVQRQLGI